jgi:uncharacterized CHY-type Zn-finger protein
VPKPSAEGTATDGSGSGAGGGSSAPPSGAPAPGGSPATSEFKQWCPRCSLLHTLSFRPVLVHEGNPSLGYVDAGHCAVVGLRAAALLATCLECGAMAECRSMAPPAVWEVSCRTCYNRLRLEVRDTRVQLADPAGASGNLTGSAAAAADARRKRGQRFTPGQPLPRQGACDHYKHSYRWLVFPCCSTAYPCDVCHDLAADHVHEWAKRMICGHCAREQPYANQPCVACGASLGRRAAGPVSRHWEGGKGQRNQRLMSRKDSRKYKNTAAKTRSARLKSRGRWTNKATAYGRSAKGDA